AGPLGNLAHMTRPVSIRFGNSPRGRRVYVDSVLPPNATAGAQASARAAKLAASLAPLTENEQARLHGELPDTASLEPDHSHATGEGARA
ncbi:MAG TPA: hypothetical protein VL598_06170, partial [Trinickia sp.]|uniref:hypothetical protein n=1 Tax=Trinickia sp. TaxID=2571163 RepID=UPI002BE20E6F